MPDTTSGLGALEDRQALHVRGVRKEIERAQRTEPVAAVEQTASIAGQRRRIARHVDDARRLLDGGYRLSSLRAFDLFPNTPHVESVAVFDR